MIYYIQNSVTQIVTIYYINYCDNMNFRYNTLPYTNFNLIETCLSCFFYIHL